MAEYNYLGKNMKWRKWLIGLVAKACGVLVHIDGFPCGGCRNLKKQKEHIYG